MGLLDCLKCTIDAAIQTTVETATNVGVLSPLILYGLPFTPIVVVASSLCALKNIVQASTATKKADTLSHQIHFNLKKYSDIIQKGCTRGLAANSRLIPFIPLTLLIFTDDLENINLETYINVIIWLTSGAMVSGLTLSLLENIYKDNKKTNELLEGIAENTFLTLEGIGAFANSMSLCLLIHDVATSDEDISSLHKTLAYTASFAVAILKSYQERLKHSDPLEHKWPIPMAIANAINAASIVNALLTCIIGYYYSEKDTPDNLKYTKLAAALAVTCGDFILELLHRLNKLPQHYEIIRELLEKFLEAAVFTHNWCWKTLEHLYPSKTNFPDICIFIFASFGLITGSNEAREEFEKFEDKIPEEVMDKFKKAFSCLKHILQFNSLGALPETSEENAFELPDIQPPQRTETQNPLHPQTAIIIGNHRMPGSRPNTPKVEFLDDSPNP